MQPVPSPTEMATTNGAAPTAPEARTRARRRRWWIGGLIVCLMAWAIAITYSVTAGGRSPERLSDADARTVNRACIDAQHALARLPSLGTHPTPAQRADRVDRE